MPGVNFSGKTTSGGWNSEIIGQVNFLWFLFSNEFCEFPRFDKNFNFNEGCEIQK